MKILRPVWSTTKSAKDKEKQQVTQHKHQVKQDENEEEVLKNTQSVDIDSVQDS